MNTLFVLVLRRSVASRGMLAMVALGVLVAATLLASAPIYARTMADLGLTFAINDEISEMPAVRVEFPGGLPIASPDGVAQRDAVEKRIEERLGWFQEGQSRHTKLGWFQALKPGQEIPAMPPFGQPQSLTGWETHVRLIEGAMPVAAAVGEPIQVVVGVPGATSLGVKPGDRLTMRQEFDTCERQIPLPDAPPPPPCPSPAILAFTFPVVVTGIVEPAAPDDPFWVQGWDFYTEPFRIELPDMGPIVPMLADESALLQQFSAIRPAYRSTGAWHVFASPERFNRTNFERAYDDIKALHSELQPMGGYAFSQLTNTFDGFRTSNSYQQRPLTILLLEITAIALFYVALVSAIVIERESAEIGLLRGRGATNRQVLVLYVVQGLVLGLPALFIAPFLAAGVTALLGLTPVFEDVSNGELLPVAIPPMAFVMAALAIVLSVAALVLPAYAVSRKGTMSVRRAASRPGKSIVQRYYLDVALAGVAILLLVQLRQRGSVFTPSPTGGLSSDPLLLASPALTIAAAGALILRFYPVVIRLFARVISAAAGASVALGLTQTVRNSGQYTRLALLLMMAVAVGTFAASYTRTTDESYEDRARYAAGTDMRANPGGAAIFRNTAKQVDTYLNELPGVELGTAIIRTRAAIAAPGVSTADYQLLAVDPDAMANIAWFRDDFSERSLDELLFELGVSPAAVGRVLPGRPTRFSLWVRGDGRLIDVNLWAKLRDASGRFWLVEIGRLATNNEWREISATVQDPLGPATVYPVSIASFLISEPSNRLSTQHPPLYIDDITVIDAAGTTTVLDDFEAGTRWTPFPTRGVKPDLFDPSPDFAKSGRQSGKFTFHTGSTIEARGLYVAEQITPLPAVVSESFAAGTGIRPGFQGLLRVGTDTIVPIAVRGTFKLFPTTPSTDGAVVIVNREQLMAWVETASFTSSPYLGLNEVWLTLQPGADEDAIAELLADDPLGADRTVRLSDSLSTNERNPLIAAGGSGILFVAFLAILALVAAAMLATLVTGIRRRRTEFAVVRALGMSRGEIVRMIALEYVLVFSAGIVAGAILGLIVGRQMLSFLNVNEAGDRIEPEFVLQTNWAVVFGAVGVVIIAFAVALAVGVINGNRTSDSTALRTE